ncbi:MAG: hypothetical protein Kow00114_15480 [Kiloniellaceae bacterium]
MTLTIVWRRRPGNGYRFRIVARPGRFAAPARGGGVTTRYILSSATADRLYGGWNAASSPG